MIIDTTDLWTGRLARKTKGLKAVPMRVCLFSIVAPYFSINTREGYIKPDLDTMLCVGADDEPWQQPLANLQRGYDAVGVDGIWTLYAPKPSKVVEFFEITSALVASIGAVAAPLFITGQWGQTIDGIPNLQRCHVGDFIARNPDDLADQWVVQRSIWLRTYEETS